MSTKKSGFIETPARTGMSNDASRLLETSDFLAMGKMIAGPQTVTIEQLVERQAEAARKQREKGGNE